MQKHVKIKKIFAYSIIVIFVGTIMTCASRTVLYTGGPFSQKLLQQNNLIMEKTYNNLHMRIVYPGTVSDLQQRQLIEQYIQTFPEKRIFDDSISTEELNNEVLDPNEEHHLAIYGYIMAYRIKIVSLVFQVQYWTNKFKKTERWYTLNYNRNTQAIITLNSLFKDFAMANTELEQYITQEIIRQDTLKNISTESKKTLSLKNTIHNFSFIPSRRYRKKFIGLQIYINTNQESIDVRSPNTGNKNYAINIPYSFIERHMIKKAQTYFIKVPFPYNNDDISKKHILVFPDLRDNKF